MSEQDLLKQLQSLNIDTTGIINSSNITNVDRMKVAVCGKTKTGKSYGVAKGARKPLLHYDFDDRKESIAGLQDVFIKTLVDIDDMHPTAWAALESDTTTYEYLAKKGQMPFASVALDSIQFLRKYAEHQMLKDANHITRTRAKIGVTEYLIPKDWDAVSCIQKMLETMLSRWFSMGIDVYAMFHTRPEKDIQKSTKTETVYKDTLTVDPPNLIMLLPKFNDVWQTKFDDGRYVFQLKPNWEFNAATVLRGVKDIEEADIQALLAKHHKNGRP